jgi:OmpA family.
MMIFKTIFSMMFVGALTVAQTNSPATLGDQQPDPEKATATMVGASEAAPVFFEPGVKALSPQEKTELQAFLTNIREKQKIKNVKVLAWADREYPAKQEKASEKQIALAKARAEEIQKYLKNDMKVTSVDTFNMAERPSKISEVLKTEDYEVKSTAEAAGAAPKKKNVGFFEEMGRSTTALVLVVTE